MVVLKGDFLGKAARPFFFRSASAWLTVSASRPDDVPAGRPRLDARLDLHLMNSFVKDSNSFRLRPRLARGLHQPLARSHVGFDLHLCAPSFRVRAG